MRTFIDKTGQPWVLDVTVGHLLNIHTELKLNLMDGPNDMENLTTEKQVGILWITCIEQAKRIGLGPVDFAHRLSPEAFAEAWGKWMEEWVDFFDQTSPAIAQLVRGSWDTSKKLDQARAKLIQQAFSSTSLGWLESQVSILEATKDGCSSS